MKEVVIEDDTFTIRKDRVAEICELLIARGLNRKLRWLCNARVNLDYDTMVLMRRAGCHLIIPGIESGSQEVLNNIRKGATLAQVEQYMADARRAKIKVHACYMVGNRGETRETMQQTLDLAMRLKADTAQFYPLLPFPGTEAYRWAKENGYIKGSYDDYVKEDGTDQLPAGTPRDQRRGDGPVLRRGAQEVLLATGLHPAQAARGPDRSRGPQALAQGVRPHQGLFV